MDTVKDDKKSYKLLKFQWDDSFKEIYNAMDTKTLDDEKEKWLTKLQDAVLH